MERQFFIIDTNVIIDYVEIIPNGTDFKPENPTVDLSNAHIVIPTAVIRELSNFKSEKSHRGKAARTALSRLEHLTRGKIKSISEAYNLQNPIEIHSGNQVFSILPIHKNFKHCLPFCPSESDMDGQIILAALTVGFLEKNLPIDGTASKSEVNNFVAGPNVTLLTNDNGLAIRARERTLQARHYGYDYPEPYTGRRNVTVPKKLFDEFFTGQKITRKTWEKLMPEESPLIANEFIVMNLANPKDYPYDIEEDTYFDYVGRYDVAEDAIVHLKHINKFPTRIQNVGQAIYAEALMIPGISAVICTGPAGSGKTYMATIYGYNACNHGEYIEIAVIPCSITGDNLGALPGDLDEKMDPVVRPIKNALRNYLIKEDCAFKKKLELWKKAAKDGVDQDDKEMPIKERLKNSVNQIWNNWFTNIPIEHAKGLDFTETLAFYDEFQDQAINQADTLIKRLGDGGKMIIAGDIDQIHAPYVDPYSNGLSYVSAEMFDSEMVAQVCFTEEEVIRHPLVKLIAMRQKARRQNRQKSKH